MSSELQFDWGDVPTPTPKIKKAPKEVKPKIDVIVESLTEHNCASNHKSYETFIKCALRRYNYNEVEKAALPRITVKGDGPWATVHESLSDIYESFSYDTDREYQHQHQNLEVILFRTVEEAAEWQKFQIRFCQSATRCSDSCNSKGMWGYVSKIVI